MGNMSGDTEGKLNDEEKPSNQKQPRQKNTSVQNRISIGLFLYNLILMTIAMATTIILSKITEEMYPDASGFRLGLIDSSKYVGNLIMAFPLVWISNRIGRKFTLIIGVFSILIGLTLLYFSSVYWILVLARFITGFNALMGVVSALSCDHFSEERRGSPLSIGAIGSVIGYLVGTLIGSPIYDWLGPNNSFLFIGAITSVNILILFIFIKDVPRSVRMADTQSDDKTKPKTWVYIRNNKKMVALLASTFLGWIVMSGSAVFVVYVIFTHMGKGNEGGLFIIPSMLAQAVMFGVLGARRKNFDGFYKFIIFIGLGVLVTVILMFFFDQNVFIYSLSAMLVCIVFAGLMQATDSISHKMIPAEHKTNLVSIYRIFGTLGSIIGPSLFMAQVQYIHVYSPGIFLVLMEGIFLILYFTLIREKTPSSHIPSEINTD